MGEELCKGCQNNASLSNNEGDLSKIANFSFNNSKINNTLTIKNSLNTKNSLFEINENEKSSQRITKLKYKYKFFRKFSTRRNTRSK